MNKASPISLSFILFQTDGKDCQTKTTIIPERNQNLILFPVVPKFGPSFPLNKLSTKQATQGGKETMNYIYTSNLTLHHAMLN